ncbi:gamma-glutamyltransferase [Salinarimonas sp.]|uniref:gamma-glutamyltransferase family protein n=1 Tax=Salinarimonas sp. TaxID=2766526 RepID=UPI0032D9786A
MIAGPRHAVSAGHHLATSAAFAVLEAGGNAVDAGCAAGLALGVVQPDLVGIGGVAPIMIRMAHDPEPVTIDGLGVWPASLPERHFLEVRGGTVPEGVERIVTPAAVDAWLTALERFGTMPFREVAQAALRYARDGFATHALMRGTIVEHQAGYARWPSSAAVFLPAGGPPALGARFVQSDLARTLDYLCAEEAAASGDRAAGLAAVRRAFYRGDVAREIVRFVRREGGFLDESDMARFRCRVEPAVSVPWRGRTLHVCGAWCQGPVLAMALRQIDEIDLDGLAHNSTAYIHLILGVLDNAFADREYHFGDPLFVDVPLQRLLSREHARARVSGLDRDRAPGRMPEPLLESAANGADRLPGHDPRPAPDTSYVAVVDRHGNAFSATPSDGSWDVPVVPGTGIVPSSRGSQSRPDPRHPAGARAGKRPRLTPNPAMLASEAAIMPFGTPGGDVQSQAMLQFLLNHVHFGMSLQEAVEAPRFASFNFPGSFAPFAYAPGLVRLEASIGEGVAEALAARGHRVETWAARDWRAGAVCAVESRADDGLVLGAADPRRPCAAIAG